MKCFKGITGYRVHALRVGDIKCIKGVIKCFNGKGCRMH